MPSNAQYADLLDEFKASIDPMDVATLFAGLRNSVPLGMLFRHGELGPEEMTELNAVNPRRSPAAASTGNQPLPDRLEMTPSQIEMQNIAFNMQYRDPRVFGVHPDKPSINNQMLRAMMDEYNRQGRDPFSKETATRRRDFEEAPMRADQFMSAAPKKKKFSKGGGVKKSLDEMMAEMAQKGVKLADKPDLARRGFMGLGKALDFPLAKLDKDMFKNAPAITEKTVTVDPGKGAAKSTLKSLSETPMSRREVLQSAAGQVMRGVLPDMGGLSSLGNVAKVAESVAPAAAPAFTNPYAMIMSMLKEGKSEEDIIKLFAKEKPNVNKYALNQMIDNVYRPSEYLAGDLPTLKTPSGALREMAELSEGVWDDHLSPLKMRPELRQLRSADPDAYKGMVDAARDISMSSVEEATNLGLKQKWIDKFMRGEISYDKLPQYYQRKIDNINAGFGGE